MNDAVSSISCCEWRMERAFSFVDFLWRTSMQQSAAEDTVYFGDKFTHTKKENYLTVGLA